MEQSFHPPLAAAERAAVRDGNASRDFAGSLEQFARFSRFNLDYHQHRLT
jgi:hypothetical protein